MPRRNGNPTFDTYYPSENIRQVLLADLGEAQKRFKDHVVGRSLACAVGPNVDAATALWREGITYIPNNAHVNYLVQDDVCRAVMHHRTGDDFGGKIAGAAPTAQKLAVVMRDTVYAVALSSDPTSEKTQHYGVVALCEEAWLSDTEKPFDIGEEARAVRFGLVGDDTCCYPRLWLGCLAARPCLLDFALEQLDLGIPNQLEVGQAQLIRRAGAQV